MKTVLLHVAEDEGFESRFNAAIDLVCSFQGHLSCVQATPFDSFLLTDPFGGTYAMPAVMEQVRNGEERQRRLVEERLGREGISWNWLHFDGSAAQILVDRARLADLIVLSLRQGGGSGRKSLDVVADVALHARTAVLAVPPAIRTIDCRGTAVGAWNGAPESSHALRAALPLLEKAAAVHVVTITDDRTDFPATEACEYLARHGVAAQLHEWPRNGRSIGGALIEAATTLNAAFLVAGCYGHSRLREAVLGGATRELLETSPLPLLLAH